MCNDRKIGKTILLSNGWYMVEPITRPIAMHAYSRLDFEELAELEVANVDEKGFIERCLTAEHSCAVFAGTKLVFIACANWVELDGKRCRLWDTMSTNTVRREGLCNAFVRHTPEMIDAFALGEPSDEVIGICKSDFYRSRKWIERVAKWREIGCLGINDVWHTVYKKEV